MNAEATPAQNAPIPMAMLAELTHRCPLRCPYCSNPLELAKRSEELDTATWLDVFDQAAWMGVLQLHLSGGEPAARRDLEELTSGASASGLYTNLITSGVGLTEARLKAMASDGLDHVQLSIQGADSETADLVGGYRGGFDVKMRVAEWVASEGLPLTVNAVMHRQNLEQLPQMIELALKLGARRLEVAHTQYHGWAYKNRAALMPSVTQLKAATATVAEARERHRGVLAIDYVTPDWLAKYPKPCMGGWGRIGLNVTPSGKVLPCHAAETIEGLKFENVRDRPLAKIWRDGPAFNAYRGTAWMPEPCQSCDRREQDWGGCRCQAFAFSGDAGTVDPACSKAPNHSDMRSAAMAMADAAEHSDAAADRFEYREFS